jgi:hypothetical protein
MLHGFHGAIAVRFSREHHQANRSSVASDSGVEAFRLDRERPGIVVGLAMDKKQRGLILSANHKGDILV